MKVKANNLHNLLIFFSEYSKVPLVWHWLKVEDMKVLDISRGYLEWSGGQKQLPESHVGSLSLFDKNITKS